MKKLTAMLLGLVLAMGLMAQDVIITKSDDLIKVYNLEIGNNVVYYQLTNEADAPIQKMTKADIFIIKKADGTKIDPNETAAPATAAASSEASGLIVKQPAADNESQISFYNPEIHLNLKRGKGYAHSYFPIMGMCSSSVLSNEDVTLSIVPMMVNTRGGWQSLMYGLMLENKTDKIIYVDLLNSFRVTPDNSQPYYDGEITTVSSGASGGLGVNLGYGISVGGGTSGSTSTTFGKERVIAIPPHSKKNMQEYKEVLAGHGFSAEYKVITPQEEYSIKLNRLTNELPEDYYLQYTEETTPYTVGHVFTYSFSPNFSTYSQVNAKLYVRYAVDEDYSRSYNVIKAIQKFVPEFWDNKGVIVGKWLFLAN